jgi:putative membrane protein
MAFIDDLALVEVLLLLAASVLTYVGLTGWWAMRRNDPVGLRNAIKGGAIPVGMVGGFTLALALWGEMTWPFPGSMAGYNIFFLDVMALFGIVMVAYAIGAYYSLRLQYLGILALVAGAVTIFYGYTGYTATPAFTKDPFDTLLLYLGFGVAGIAAFPASIVVDLYLAAAEGNSTFWTSVATSQSRQRLGMAARGIGAIPGSKPKASNETEEASSESMATYRVPYILQLVILAFPLFMALAGLAAGWYFAVTLPGHLGLGPAKAP